MKYQVQTFGNTIVLVEQRNDEIPPVILDIAVEDQNILMVSIGEVMNEDDFKIDEVPIEEHPGQFHTVARLIIDDAIRAKL